MFGDPSYAPLCEMGLPPRHRPWQRIPETDIEGYITMQIDGSLYGDGSSYRQQLHGDRIATWSVVRIREVTDLHDSINDVARNNILEAIRGTVPGYFSTVPRAEAYAIWQFLRHAGLAATCGGDCQHVLDIVKNGVAPPFTSSRCPNADRWTRVKRAIADHGTPPIVTKIKAHTTRSAAENSGESITDWLGNRCADAHCKQLAKEMTEADPAPLQLATDKKRYREVMKRISLVMQWAFRHRPQYATGKKKGKKVRKLSLYVTQPAYSQHNFQHCGGEKWRCLVCRREAWSRTNLERFRNEQCCGHIAAKCHKTHALSIQDGVLWCRNCGAYTSRQPRSLKQPCPRRPPSEAAANVRSRLARGLPPTTAQYLTGASITVSGSGLQEASCSSTRVPMPTTQAQRGDEFTQVTSAPQRTVEQTERQEPQVCHGTVLSQPMDDDTMEPEGGHHTPKTAEQSGPQVGRGSSPTRNGLTKTDAAYLSSRYRVLDQRRGCVTELPEKGPAALTTTRGSPTAYPPRRRITGKQSMDTSSVAPVPTEAVKKARCNPAATQPWSARIAIGRTAVARPCHTCKNLCRGQCTGCSSVLCISCARARRACEVGTADTGNHPTGIFEYPSSSSPSSSPVHHLHHLPRVGMRPFSTQPVIAPSDTRHHPLPNVRAAAQATRPAAMLVAASAASPDLHDSRTSVQHDANGYNITLPPVRRILEEASPLMPSPTTAAADADRVAACSVSTVSEVLAVAADAAVADDGPAIVPG